MVFIADNARPSEIGFAFALTYASIAWVNASTPVSAVSLGGIDIVSSESTIDAIGRNDNPGHSIFSSVATSVMMVMAFDRVVTCSP